MRSPIVILALPFALATPPAWAAPVRVPYSGQIAEAGVPIEGSHDVAVSLYATAQLGTRLFTQTGSLQFEHGIFHTDLLVDDAIFLTNDSLWVGVSLDGALELSPRVRIGAVPFAVRALAAAPSIPPGVAFATGLPTVDVSATATWQPVAQLTLSAPADGYAWVNCSGFWEERSNTIPNYVGVEFILGETNPPPSDQRQQSYSFFQFKIWPFSHSTVMPAAMGSHTYTLWVRVTYPAGTLASPPTIHPSTMQAMWVSASYGN